MVVRYNKGLSWAWDVEKETCRIYVAGFDPQEFSEHVQEYLRETLPPGVALAALRAFTKDMFKYYFPGDIVLADAGEDDAVYG
jgi:hypothetical protein